MGHTIKHDIANRRWGRRASPRLADILKPEDNSFGVIRLAMALAVLVSHSVYFVTGQSSAEPLVTWTGHSLGEHAVQVFFFLSGILVTHSLLRSGSVIDFTAGRGLRIVPGLFVCIGLTAVALGPIVTRLPVSTYLSDTALPRYVIKTALLITGAAPLPGVFETLPAAGLVNMSLWTLKYEVLCYVGLALIGSFGLLRDRTRLVTAFVLAPIVFTVFLRAPSPSDTYTALDNLRYFALYFGVGVLAVLHKDHVRINAVTPLVLLGVFALARATPWAELTCALFLGSATLLAATWSMGPFRRLTNQMDLSFGVYIYGAPIQQALLVAIPGLGPVGLTLAALPPVLALACASWVWIERPALRIKPAVSIWLQRTLAVWTKQSTSNRRHPGGVRSTRSA
jgi:peptidoglycan/LPS O-acetylase OafA/YrhL